MSVTDPQANGKEGLSETAKPSVACQCVEWPLSFYPYRNVPCAITGYRCLAAARTTTEGVVPQDEEGGPPRV